MCSYGANVSCVVSQLKFRIEFMPQHLSKYNTSAKPFRCQHYNSILCPECPTLGLQFGSKHLTGVNMWQEAVWGPTCFYKKKLLGLHANVISGGAVVAPKVILRIWGDLVHTHTHTDTHTHTGMNIIPLRPRMFQSLLVISNWVVTKDSHPHGKNQLVICESPHVLVLLDNGQAGLLAPLAWLDN